MSATSCRRLLDVCGFTYTKSRDIWVRGALVVIVVRRLIVNGDSGHVVILGFEQRRSDVLYDCFSVQRKTARLCTLTACCMIRPQMAFLVRPELRTTFSLVLNQVYEAYHLDCLANQDHEHWHLPYMCPSLVRSEWIEPSLVVVSATSVC
jgi:hypothetical protein